MSLALLTLCLAGAGNPSVQRAPVEPGYHPWTNMPKGPGIVDLSYEGRRLNNYVDGETDQEEVEHEDGPPEGWVQVGDQLLPREIVLGFKAVDPEPNYAWEDIPGNKYPRKHTVYLNFDGGPMQGGADNSAENKSVLAKYGDHPGSGWGSQTRAGVAQGMAADMSRYGIRLMYQERPSKIVPYTMVMFGGSACSVTNMEDCGSGIGGVAPGGDCEAHGQRHVVYSFVNGSNTPSHEAGHVFGLDHTTNCSALMSYCGGGDKVFSTSCDGLCEEACQGPGTIGCRAVHEKHCGDGSDRQNDDIELDFIFGGTEPDNEAPYVSILSPEDGLEVGNGDDVLLRAEVADNYGGVGWKIIIEQDGEVVYDQVDYHKDNIDDDANVALNLVRPEPGTYVVTVRAEDHADHITDDSITFTVSEEGGGDDGGTGDGGGDDGGGTGDGGGDDGGGTGDGGGDDGGGDDGGDDGGGIGPWDDGRGDDEKGCGCSTQGAPQGTAALILGLWALGLRRRRA
jgi:MYXO-CTERM domain-containing protein